ncbi:pentapeptide repeat-containing protein [Nonomuraea turkmeniaca]|uniref:pentapeptide repeat-containing protein n=1 Tax=Nonomuraea turkmeniaca TaxID=103838 RepID=UPI003CCC69F6
MVRSATFTGDTSFEETTFAKGASFERATFTGHTTFWAAYAGADINLEKAQGVHPRRAHVWPHDWDVVTGPAGAVLKRYEPPDDGANDEQAHGEPTVAA